MSPSADDTGPIMSPGDALLRALDEARASHDVRRAASRRWRDWLYADSSGFGSLVARMTGRKRPTIAEAAKVIVSTCVELERKGLLERPVVISLS